MIGLLVGILIMTTPLPFSTDGTLSNLTSATGDILPSLPELAADLNHPSLHRMEALTMVVPEHCPDPDLEKGMKEESPAEVTAGNRLKERPYSAFGKHTRWMIVALSVLAGFFSYVSKSPIVHFSRARFKASMVNDQHI